MKVIDKMPLLKSNIALDQFFNLELDASEFKWVFSETTLKTYGFFRLL